MGQDIITVSSPLLPPLKELLPYLEEIWTRRWLTNHGRFHEQLEAELRDYLKVPYLSLVSNGTLALMVALQALGVSGEAITSPYSFVATTHSLWWNKVEPVFADVDPRTLNLDPAKIEAAITPRTTAILPVHVYGTPCDDRAIGEIAARHGLKVIYDAAHAFAVEENGASVLSYGDVSILSFHATKSYSTIEGGAVVCRTEEMKRRIDHLRNFGFEDEVTVVGPGINAKLNEVQSAYGLACLKHFERGVQVRKRHTESYRRELNGTRGITFLGETPGIRANYSYFPIFVDPPSYGHSRDELYERLKQHRIFGRRYFYPLISDFPPYRELPSAARSSLPVAAAAADRVICLPMHAELKESDVSRIVEVVKW
jgi:dTDP-4-amino-4,6-dideoxygalactose transaminase